MTQLFPAMDKEEQQRLKELYLSSESNVGFTNAAQLYRQAKAEGLKLSRKQVREWLETQDLFTAYKPAVRKFLRRRVIPRGYMDLIDGDIAFMVRFAEDNDQIKYLAIFLDTFSRQLWAYPLLDKTSDTMLKTIKQFLKDSIIQCNSFRFDYGGEYTATKIRDYLESRSIYVHYARSPKKANFSERVISSLKNRIYKYMYAHQTNRYVDQLPSLVQAYNLSYHRSIRRSPASIGKHNEVQIWIEQYVPKCPRKTPVKFKFDKGNLVRLVYPQEKFGRGFYQKYTEAIYIIKQRFPTHPPTYKIKDQKGMDVGSVYYEPELSRVRGSLDTMEFKVLKILKKRTRKTKKGPVKEALVSWVGYPDSYNSWEPLSAVQ